MWTALWLGSVALGASVSVGPGDDLYAVTASLQPGDTISFQDGTYELDGTLVWTGAGTAEQPITLKASQDATPILRQIGGGSVARIENASHVVVEGLVFEGDPEIIEYNYVSGLTIDESTNITVQDVVIRSVWSTGLRIDGNTSGLLVQRTEISTDGDGSGIYVGCGDASCWMQDSVLQQNLVHHVAGDGIHLEDGCQGNSLLDNVVFETGDEGIQVSSTELGPQNVVEGNVVWHTLEDGLYIEGAVIARNNVVFETGGDGVATNNTDRDGLLDVVISHNTFARNDGYAAYLDDWYERPGMVFANNALANPTGYGLFWDDLFEDLYGVDSDNYIRNNVITGLVEGVSLLDRPDMVIPGGGFTDFLDADNWDFYPTGSSALVNAGETAGDAYIPEVDFNGAPREGNAPDVGAYEWNGSENPGWTVQEGFKELGYTAGGDSYDVSSGCCGGKTKQDGTEAVLFLPLLGLGVLARRRR